MLNPDTIAAQLAALDAAVSAAPREAKPLEARAQFHALHFTDKMLGVTDCREALQLCLSQGRLKRGGLMKKGRVWLKRALANKAGSFRFYFLAQAVAHFDVAIASAPRNAIAYKGRGIAWAQLKQRARAEADFDKWRALKSESLQSWRTQAQAFSSHEALDTEAAVFAYRRVIALSAGGASLARCLSRARAKNTPYLQALACLDLAVELAPHSTEPHLERAIWWTRRDQQKADADWQRALALRPDDPTTYETRARLQPTDVDGGFERAVADYAHALRLRLATGKPRGSTKMLRRRADKLKGHRGAYPNNVQAFAVYNVAIERAPHDAMLYALRASLTRKIFYFDGDDPFADKPNAATLQSALEDEMRALRLNGNLKTPRTALVKHFARRLADVTAHEQLEGLLDMRAQLREAGVSETLAASISSEVEATLRDSDHG